MKIDISTLNKETFIAVLKEEVERQTINKRMIECQIEDNYRFDGDEELVKELDRLKSSFNMMIIQLSKQNKSILEITDEDVKFFERMIRNQICISDSRIKDWQPNGLMRNATRSKYFACPGANDKDFEEVVQDIIQYEVDLKDCVNELAKIINVE